MHHHAVELPSALNPLADVGVEIFVLPAEPQTLKDPPAQRMLHQAYVQNKLAQKLVFVPSSGNFVWRVLVHAQKYGVKVVPVVLNNLPAKKMEFLEEAGAAEIIVVESGTIARAEQEALNRGGYVLNQYTSKDNWHAHRIHSGPRVWAQTRRRVSLLAQMIGSSGTIGGASEYLKKKNPRLKSLGVMLQEEGVGPSFGGRTLARIKKDVTLGYSNYVDDFIEVGEEDSYRYSCKLDPVMKGRAGPSSGSILCGLLAFLAKVQAAGRLDEFRNQSNRVVAALMCPDGSGPYVKGYERFLSSEEFAVMMAK